MTNALTFRALSGLPPALQVLAREHVAAHPADELGDLVSEIAIALAELRGAPAEVIYSRARSRIRRATQDPVHYSCGIDIERHDAEQDDEPTALCRRDIVREIAQRQHVTRRRAQQIVRRALERAAQGDLFFEAGGCGMSIKYMTLAFRARVGNPLTKLILLKLADHANDDGICWPTVRRIAEDAECNERTVRHHIRRLEALGLLVERRQQDGVNLPSVYRLRLEGVGAERPQGWGRSAPLTVKNIEPSSKPAAACTAAAADAAAPQQISAGPSPAHFGKRRRVRHSGLVTWLPDDETAAERLEQTASSADITAAIESVINPDCPLAIFREFGAS